MSEKRKAKRPPKKIFLQKRKQNRERAVQQESVFHFQKRQLAKKKDLFAEDTDTDTDTVTVTDADTETDTDTEDTVTAKKAKPSRELDNRSRGETSAGTSQDA